MKKMINRTHVEGILYQHSLERKVSGPNSKKPGTEYITGTIEIATNDKMTNIVPIHFTYETAVNSSGKTNDRFSILSDIIDKKIGCYTDPAVGDAAAKLRIDSAIGLNEFYSDRSGKEELVSVKRIEGGFIHTANSISENEKQRSTFEADVVIVGVTERDAIEDDHGNITSPEKVIIDGRIFDFRNNILPVTFSAVSRGAIDYFLGLGASKSEPVFTKVRGQIVSEQTIRLITEESAFGEDSVREVSTTNRDYVVTWAMSEPYDFGDESVLTLEDMKKAGQERENTLATLKQRNDEYRANRAAPGNAIGTTATANKAPKDAEYNF